MANKILTIKETRTATGVTWWKVHAEEKYTELKPQDRSHWYNIRSVGEGMLPEGSTVGNWSTELSGDGLTYTVFIEHSDEHPVNFFEEEHESYKERMAYNENNGIVVEVSVAEKK